MRRMLIAIFFLALAARLGLLLAGPWHDPQRAFLKDSARYLVLAENLRKHFTFGKAEEEGRVHRAVARVREANGTLPPPDGNDLRPESFRTPGYPLFLAGIQIGTTDLRVVLAVQCLLGAFLAVAAALTAESLGLSRLGATVVGLLWALHPALIVYDLLILSENLFNVFCIGGLLAAARAKSLHGFLLAGAILGCAGIVRPLGLAYFPAAAILTWRLPRFRWLAILLLGLTATLPSVFWAFRNQAVGEGLRVTTVGDLKLLYYTAAYTISEERGEDWSQSWPQRVDELTEKLEQEVRPGEDVYGAARRLATEEILARPAAATRVHVKALFKLMMAHSCSEACQLLGVPYAPSGLFARLLLREKDGSSADNWGTIIAALVWTGFNVAITLAATMGFLIALKRREYALVLIGGLTIALFLIATGSVGLERFRLPMMLPLFLLAGRAAEVLIIKLTTKDTKTSQV